MGYHQCGKTLCVLVIALVVGFSGTRPVAAETDALAQGVALLKTEYDDILDLFYRPVEPAPLLAAGWQALTSELLAQREIVPPLGSLPADRAAAFATFEIRFRQFAQTMRDPAKKLLTAYIIADGMTQSLGEQHSNFLSLALTPDLLDGLNGGSEYGTGMHLTDIAPWIVAEVAKGGQADLMHITVGDVIVGVNGKAVDGDKKSIRPALTGHNREGVWLTIDRDGARREVHLAYSGYLFPALSSRMLGGNVGYVRLNEFAISGIPTSNGLQLLTDLDRRLDDLDLHGARALILDLRDNPGGDVSTADGLLGRFLPEDALSMTHFDERGHRATGIVSGQMRRTQLPMAVLVNRGSASSAESVASTLREADRALLVGQKTGGALATSEILILPAESGLQLAFAEVVASRSGQRIDGAGVGVDVDVPDYRTAADYRAGRDPQLEAAVAALPSAPPPPAFHTTPSELPADRLRILTNGYSPDTGSIAVNGKLIRILRALGSEFVHPNLVAGFGAREPLVLQQALRERGWLGRHQQTYAIDIEGGREVAVAIDVYRTHDGAAAALVANDFPDLQVAQQPAETLGEGAVAYRGTWMARGADAYSWQRGNAVVTVYYIASPGSERSDVPLAMAKQVDQIFARYPLGDSQVAKALPATTGPAAAASVSAPTVAPAPNVASNAAPTTPDRGNGLPGNYVVLVLGSGVAVLAGLVFISLRRRPRSW